MGGTKALLLASQYPDTFTKVTHTEKRRLEQKQLPSPPRHFFGEGKSCLHILNPPRDSTATMAIALPPASSSLRELTITPQPPSTIPFPMIFTQQIYYNHQNERGLASLVFASPLRISFPSFNLEGNYKFFHTQILFAGGVFIRF